MSIPPRDEAGERLADAEAVAAARRERDFALTPSERVERLHVLCAQLSVVAEAPRVDRS